MNLSEWKKKRTTDLSKGMQQKIQFISTVLARSGPAYSRRAVFRLDPVNVEFMIDVLDEFSRRIRRSFSRRI